MRLITSTVFILLLLTAPAGAFAEPVTPSVQATFDLLMEAIADDDYPGFIAKGHEEFKQGINKKAFDSVNKQLGDLLNQGYKSEYLGELIQQGYQVHLWKIAYSATTENTLAKLALNNGKVMGFYLQ